MIIGHKPLITNSNCASRLKWCKVQQQQTVQQQRQVLWGDESRYTLYRQELLVIIHGNLNTGAYRSILNDSVLFTLRQIYGLDPCHFHDGNASYRVMKSIMNWYGYNEINRLNWPFQSPYLNHVENLWDELSRRIKKCNSCPKSVEQLSPSQNVKKYHKLIYKDLQKARLGGLRLQLSLVKTLLASESE